MHSSVDTLIRMANQIGKFFAPQGEARAIAGISDHVRKFWEPRMKKQIFAHLDAGGAGLDPLTLKALEKLKADMHGMPTMAEARAAAAAAAPAPRPAVEPPKVTAGAAAGGNGKRVRG